MNDLFLNAANLFLENDDNAAGGEYTKYTDVIFNHPIIKPVIENFGYSLDLDYGLAFNIMEAVYIYTHDYNDYNDRINSLNKLMRDVEFKPSPLLNTFEDLEETGKDFLIELVKIYEGGMGLDDYLNNDEDEDDTVTDESYEK